MTDNEITFGMEISRLRKKLNMSQKELASLVLKDDQTPIPFSPWATIKHYFLVLTKGYIPPEYITLEVDNSKNRETN